MKNAADERILGERKKKDTQNGTLSNTKSKRWVDEEKKIEATKALMSNLTGVVDQLLLIVKPHCASNAIGLNK